MVRTTRIPPFSYGLEVKVHLISVLLFIFIFCEFFESILMHFQKIAENILYGVYVYSMETLLSIPEIESYPIIRQTE